MAENNILEEGLKELHKARMGEKALLETHINEIKVLGMLRKYADESLDEIENTMVLNVLFVEVVEATIKALDKAIGELELIAEEEAEA